jgi:lipopolysaccharide transport system permease protein
MSTDDFQTVTRVVGQSALGRTMTRGSSTVRVAAAQSAAARALDRAGRRIAGLSPTARVRLAGVLLLTATIVHRLLLQFVPAFVRPGAPALLRLEIAVGALALIGAAPWLVRAWPASRLGVTLEGPVPMIAVSDTVADIALRDTLLDRSETLSPAAYWELLVNLTRREIKGRYSQSFFGFAWAIAQPLATMLVFTFVFGRLGKMDAAGAPYPLFAYAALVPWFFFSNSVNSGMMSLITYRNIVTKTYFPREIIPLAQVASRLLDFGAAAALFALMLLQYRVAPGVWALMGVPLFVMLFAFTCAATLLTSSLNVFYRDVSPVVTIALQLWLYLTPVAYALAAVPARYRLFFVLNPLTAIIEGTRDAFVFNRPPDWSLMGLSAVIITVLLVGSFVVFKSLDRYFADVI